MSNVTTTSLVGAVPQAPLAIAWNRFAKLLFVTDRVGDQLRLLAIDPLNVHSYELWRTDVVGKGDFPTAAFLSVSAHGQIVLALGDKDGAGKTEVILFDAGGSAIASADTVGKLVDAPQAVPAGINLPVAPGLGDQLGMRVDLLARSDLSPGICGAKWLAKHASGTLAVNCKKH